MGCCTAMDVHTVCTWTGHGLYMLICMACVLDRILLTQYSTVLARYRYRTFLPRPVRSIIQYSTSKYVQWSQRLGLQWELTESVWLCPPDPLSPQVPYPKDDRHPPPLDDEVCSSGALAGSGSSDGSFRTNPNEPPPCLASCG